MKDWESLPIGELIRMCAESRDPRAWAEFVRRFQPVIASTISGVVRRASRDVLDDLVQNTFVKICDNRCKALRDFKADDPDAIFGLVKKTARNVACDYLRRIRAIKREAENTALPLDDYRENVTAGPDALSAVERRILLKEIDSFLATTCAAERRPQDRWIFWLFYRHGLTSRAIAAISGIGLSQKGIESVLRRLASRVRAWLAGRKGQP